VVFSTREGRARGEGEMGRRVLESKWDPINKKLLEEQDKVLR
jgi:hypothetical protein